MYLSGQKGTTSDICNCYKLKSTGNSTHSLKHLKRKELWQFEHAVADAGGESETLHEHLTEACRFACLCPSHSITERSETCHDAVLCSLGEVELWVGIIAGCCHSWLEHLAVQAQPPGVRRSQCKLFFLQSHLMHWLLGPHLQYTRAGLAAATVEDVLDLYTHTHTHTTYRHTQQRSMRLSHLSLAVTTRSVLAIRLC